MPTALTADAMLAALKKWGIEPKFYKNDWRTHNRNAQQGWGPINGFVVHNFGSDVSDPNSLAYLYNGDLARGMPGPLSQFSITDDGQVWVIGWGAANHTGFMDKNLHALVLKDAAPLNADFKPSASGSTPSAGAGAINPHYIGVEMTYGKAPTAAQRKSVARLGAALMDALGTGYTGGSVVGHRECTTQRSDPVGVPMFQLRKDINSLLKAGPAGTTPAVVPQEDIMASIDDLRKVIREEVAKAVWDYLLTSPTSADYKAPARSWLLGGAVGVGRVEGLTKQSVAQAAALGASLKALASNPALSLEQITAAAQAGAQAALDDKIADAVTTLNVKP